MVEALPFADVRDPTDSGRVRSIKREQCSKRSILAAAVS
jgi:hypothetical protein